MRYESEYEVNERIKLITREIKWLKESFKPTDNIHMGCSSTAEERISGLRHDLKVLREIKRKIQLDRERQRAERQALENIFMKHNGDVYPSDAGQYWNWRIENGEVICIIEDNEYREKIVYPKEK